MSNSYEFRPATRAQAKPLIGIYAESGKGKTYSALLLARGFVGPAGRIGMIETESGRGEAYADPAEYPEIGGYDVLSLRENFSPADYSKAITAAEKANLGALIIDSASHEWEGTGGVLSMAAANQAKGMKGVLVWQAPKLEHQRQFMLRFMQTPIALVILCMRAKYPMEEKQVGNEKKWVRSTVLEPKQADDILFEMFVHGWIDGEHNFHTTKCTAKSLEPVFQSGKPLSAETGRALAAWAAGGKARPQEIQPSGMVEKINTAPLLAAAQEKAAAGFDNLKRYFSGLSEADRTALAAHRADLIKAAKEADQKLAEELGA